MFSTVETMQLNKNQKRLFAFWGIILVHIWLSKSNEYTSIEPRVLILPLQCEVLFISDFPEQ